MIVDWLVIVLLLISFFIISLFASLFTFQYVRKYIIIKKLEFTLMYDFDGGVTKISKFDRYYWNEKVKSKDLFRIKSDLEAVKDGSIKDKLSNEVKGNNVIVDALLKSELKYEIDYKLLRLNITEELININ